MKKSFSVLLLIVFIVAVFLFSLFESTTKIIHINGSLGIAVTILLLALLLYVCLNFLLKTNSKKQRGLQEKTIDENAAFYLDKINKHYQRFVTKDYHLPFVDIPTHNVTALLHLFAQEIIAIEAVPPACSHEYTSEDPTISEMDENANSFIKTYQQAINDFSFYVGFIYQYAQYLKKRREQFIHTDKELLEHTLSLSRELIIYVEETLFKYSGSLLQEAKQDNVIIRLPEVIVILKRLEYVEVFKNSTFMPGGN
jgi:hypothetical protein